LKDRRQISPKTHPQIWEVERSRKGERIEEILRAGRSTRELALKTLLSVINEESFQPLLDGGRRNGTSHCNVASVTIRAAKRDSEETLESNPRFLSEQSEVICQGRHEAFWPDEGNMRRELIQAVTGRIFC
jgi:hypothetical protein